MFWMKHGSKAWRCSRHHLPSIACLGFRDIEAETKNAEFKLTELPVVKA